MSRDGAVRVRRVVCAVDCGTVVNPDTVHAQIQSAVIFDITAALYGQITLKDGRVEQSNFDSYQMLRMNEAPAIEGYIIQSSEPPGGMGEAGTSAIVPNGDQRSLPQLASACVRSTPTVLVPIFVFLSLYPAVDARCKARRQTRPGRSP
jgi:Molybdopterin-binding domain of aldehyde dehydrogenase